MKTIRLFNKINISFSHGVTIDVNTRELIQFDFAFIPSIYIVINPKYSNSDRTKWYLLFYWLLFSIQIDNDDLMEE